MAPVFGRLGKVKGRIEFVAINVYDRPTWRRGSASGRPRRSS